MNQQQDRPLWAREARTAGRPPVGTPMPVSPPGYGAMRMNERGSMPQEYKQCNKS